MKSRIEPGLNSSYNVAFPPSYPTLCLLLYSPSCESEEIKGRKKKGKSTPWIVYSNVPWLIAATSLSLC